MMKQLGVVCFVALVAVPAIAQELSLVEGFAQGFTFHAIFSTSHKTEADGSVVYLKTAADGSRIAAVRQGADPCIFLSTGLNINTPSFAAPVVLQEETYDLRGVSFVSNPKHEFAPPGGTYLMMSGPHILCRVSTGGSIAKLERRSECQDKFEATIETQMMPAFERTAEKLKTMCRWK